jgi:ABC-2 type transport system ATP-binding protein
MIKNDSDAIVVSHLSKKYKKAKMPSVDDVSFTVKNGEFFAFLGPNGAGKTTTISILTTTLSKTSGQVRIGGFDLDHQAKQIRQNIGIIFQNPSLDLELTAEENIRLHVSLYGLYSYRPFYRLMPNSYKQKIQQLAEVVGLGEGLFRKMKTFSGGMKRKLEIVRSLMHEPTILFLDEPTSGLDPLSRSELWKYLHEVREKTGTTVFLTTHYLDEAENADRVCIINNGKILLCDTPHTIKQQLVQYMAVLDADDRPALQSELAQLGVTIKGNGPFTIPINGSTAQSLIQRIATPLTKLDVHAPSLEEAYIKLIGEGASTYA